jgi:hypothetical protein
MPFWMSADLWNNEVRQVQLAYPGAEWREFGEKGNPSRVWHLSILPTPEKDELGYVLADLEEGLPMSIYPHGKVGHSLECKTSAGSHARLLAGLTLLHQEYSVDLVILPPLKGATWAPHPRAYVINPEVSIKTHPNHPHMNTGYNESWACPTSPQDGGWTWRKGTTVAYLDQVAIWLLKTAVWAKTGAGIVGLGKWVGPATSHDPASVVSIGQQDPCRCGSGLKYGQCHFRADVVQLTRTRH